MLTMARAKFIKNELLRKNKQSFLFNDLEKDALDNYCKKYNIKNKSKFIREVIITNILKQFDKDYPSLFEEFEKKKTPKYEQGVLAF